MNGSLLRKKSTLSLQPYFEHLHAKVETCLKKWALLHPNLKVVLEGQTNQVDLKLPKQSDSKKNRSTISFEQIYGQFQFSKSENPLISIFQKSVRCAN